MDMKPKVSERRQGRPPVGELALIISLLAACAICVAVPRPPNYGRTFRPRPGAVPALTLVSGGIPAWREPAPATLIAPDEVVNRDAEEWAGLAEYTLRIQKTRVSLLGAAQQGDPREVEMLTYNGCLVGPTIRARRGTTLKINVVNELPSGDPPAVDVPMDQVDPPHDLYTTNLHTHGLHVSPTGNSDNVFREIPPGSSAQYSFAIPADHPSGTFWYHPHKHGSVAYQLGNGMGGALIVEGSPADQIADLDDIPEIANAQERILVLQQLVLRTNDEGLGWFDPQDSYNDPAPDVYRATAVNGVVLPTYTMQPLEVQRWRFIGAGREGSYMLCWYDDNEMRVNSMNFYEIAVDGLATGKMTARRSVTMIPGKRSDVLIKAPERPGTYFLAALQEDESPGAEEILIVKYLARLVIQGPERPMHLPRPDQLAACKPFESVAAAECQAKREFVLSFDDKKKLFHINGRSFGEQTGLDQPVLGSAEEWTLSALDAPEGTPNEPHPFHLHVNPFEVVQIEDVRTGNVIPVNEWRDTFAVEPGKKVTVRTRFRDFSGKTVLHCHTLDHEDQGMMRTLEIVDPLNPRGESDDPGVELVACAFPAPPLTLPTPGGDIWSLEQLGKRNVILVLFRGMTCVHCVRELRDLVRESRDLVDTETLIVAVSSEPIADPKQAFQWLEAESCVELRLLVDEQRTAFRDFGCYDDHPQHGLFLIDSAGFIRASYVGETPFGNSQEVCARIRRLIDSNRQTNP